MCVHAMMPCLIAKFWSKLVDYEHNIGREKRIAGKKNGRKYKSKID